MSALELVRTAVLDALQAAEIPAAVMQAAHHSSVYFMG